MVLEQNWLDCPDSVSDPELRFDSSLLSSVFYQHLHLECYVSPTIYLDIYSFRRQLFKFLNILYLMHLKLLLAVQFLILYVRPAIGQDRSRDLETCLWLVETDHVTWIMASDWSRHSPQCRGPFMLIRLLTPVLLSSWECCFKPTPDTENWTWDDFIQLCQARVLHKSGLCNTFGQFVF